MSSNAEHETHEFQAEVNQLLQLMIHSLYSNAEIFLRELVSNASDACDKLRFLSVSDDSLTADDGTLSIWVSTDKEANTITIRDNGIGMSRDEVVENIGTIARSGTRRFLEAMEQDQRKDAGLIGQFGVGFYSSFIVADQVTLTTRRAGSDADSGIVWSSDGSGSYTLGSAAADTPRGTSITLHLREEHKEFLEPWRLRSILTKYSDHITFSIQMPKEPAPSDESEEKEESVQAAPEWETINSAKALWQQNRRDISDDDYKAFYRTVSHDYSDPLLWTHNRVEGTLEYTTLLYIPERAPFDLFERETKGGVRLYVQRVFILEDSEKLMPRYLRFVRGVIDSADLPLNVSRELLQDNRVVDKIRSASVKKLLDTLGKLAKDDKEKYETFWKTYGQVMKEGVGEEYGHREALLKLLRVRTSTDEGLSALDDVIARMKEGQQKLYFLTADSESAATNSPHLEWFKKNNVEVILLSDRVDEWMMSYLTEYEGKQFVSIAKEGLELDDIASDEDKADIESKKRDAAPLVERFKTALGEQVGSVEASARLVDSPACVVLGAHDMALYMQNLMRQAGHDTPETKPGFEINPEHALIQRVAKLEDEDRFREWAELLLDQAILAEGGQLKDGAGFVRRMNRLMMDI